MYLRIFWRVPMNLQKNPAFCRKIWAFSRKIRYEYDVTRLDSIGEAPLLEDEGPLIGCYLMTQDACDARQVMLEVQRNSGLVKMSAS
jgi:hypothetical protein